jgi:hypothetical protein
MKKTLITAVLTLLALQATQAQGVKPLPTLHVEGRWLTDQHGNHVVLHGVMDTPNAYFNGGRWGWDYSRVNPCINYFEKLYGGLEEAKCDVFRLHLDPAWTNDASVTAQGFTKNGEGKTVDPHGNVVESEADISHFNKLRLKNYLRTLYFPLIKRAMNHGMYVVVRPPGVCPGYIQVGDYYNEYLMTVWNYVTQNDSIKKYAGQISIELANEPVTLKNAEGQDDPRALHDFFQPIVDKIRSNGFTGIIWAPGTGWQANYQSYASNPIEGYNIGYAVHDYCGWYGCSDATPDPQNKINQFHNQVPVVDFAPVIITEVDWSPQKPGTGHYNEHGEWVESNYGTWATGTTSKWGAAFKAMLDHYENISMTLSGTGCLIDIDTLLNENRVVPAFGGLEEACGKACMDWYADYYQVDWPHADDEVQPEEALTVVSLSAPSEQVEVMVGRGTAIKLTATYADGHTREVTSMAEYSIDAPDVATMAYGRLRALTEGTANVTATYTDIRGNEVQASFSVRSTFFPFGQEYISTSLFAEGVYNERTHAFRPGQWGQMGWVYSDGADMSAYKYLVVKLKQTQTCNAHLNIFTDNSIWGDCCASPDFGSKKQIVINLQEATYTSGNKSGQPLETDNIHIVAFWGNGQGIIVVDDMYLTNNDDYSPMVPTDIPTPTVDFTNTASTNVYSLSGVLLRRADSRSDAVSSLPAGIYVIDGKKVVVGKK